MSYEEDKIRCLEQGLEAIAESGQRCRPNARVELLRKRAVKTLEDAWAMDPRSAGDPPPSFSDRDQCGGSGEGR